jgi:hypothetical protein
MSVAYEVSIQHEFGSLVGKTVVRVRPFVPSEYKMFAWSPNKPAFLIEFDDNTLLVPMSDETGKGAGWLYLDEL